MKLKKVLGVLLSVALVFTSIPFTLWSSAYTEDYEALKSGDIKTVVRLSDPDNDEYGYVSCDIICNTNDHPVSIAQTTIKVDGNVLRPVDEDGEMLTNLESWPKYSERALQPSVLGYYVETPVFSGKNRRFSSGPCAAKWSADGTSLLFFMAGMYDGGMHAAFTTSTAKPILTLYLALAPGAKAEDITANTIKIADPEQVNVDGHDHAYGSKIDGRMADVTPSVEFDEGVIKTPAVVDKSELVSAISAAEGQSKVGYTADSVAAFEAALASAKAVNDKADATQTEVDSAKNALVNAQKALVVDKSALNALINEAATLNESEYKATSWSVLADSLAVARSVAASANATVAQVTQAVSELQAAIDGLVPLSDYEITFVYKTAEGTDTDTKVTVKEGVVPSAPQVSGYSEGDYDYTFKAWDKEVVAAAANTVYTAEYNSKFVPADYSAYNEVLADAIEKSGQTAVYTSASLANLSSAITDNVVTEGKGRTYQSTIDAAKANIQAAIDALVAIKYYNVTFEYEQADGTVSTTDSYSEGAMPVAPVVSGFSKGDYNYTFKSWDKEIAAVSGDVTYTAVFDKTFVAANVSAYIAAVNSAKDKLALDTWTQASADALRALYADYDSVIASGISNQSTVDSLTAQIQAATESLAVQYYTVTFNFKNAAGRDYTDVQNIARHSAPVVPDIPSYDEGGFTYVFNGWNPSVVSDVTADATYTAKYINSENAADFTAYNAAVSAANNKIATGKYASDEAMAALVTLLGTDVSSWGASKQAEIDKLAQDIVAATEALNLKKFEITFVYQTADGESRVSSQVVIDTMPVAPSVSGYSAGDYDYTFVSWDKEVVSAAEDTVYTAVFSNTFVSADYTAYNAAVAAANAELDKDIYTDESVAELRQALSNNVSGLGRTSQSVVDNATSAINAAVSALTVKTFTITFNYKNGLLKEVVVEINTVPEIPAEVKENYTEGDYNYTYKGLDREVEAAVANVVYIAQYDSKFLAADYTAYNEALSSASDKVLQTGNYTSASIAALQNAIAANTVASNLGASRQSEIDEATANLIAAVNALVKLADKSALQSLYIDALVNITPVIDRYTTSTAAAYTAAMEQAKTLLDVELDETRQGELDAAHAALSAAIGGLKGKANLNDLRAALLVASAQPTDGYTAESVEALRVAITAAEEVIINADDTEQSVADAATDALKAAVNGMKVDKSELEAIIKVAQATDVTGYTAETKEALAQALSAARAVFSDENASVEDVAQAVSALRNALDNLKVDKTALEQLVSNVSQEMAEPGFADKYTKKTLAALKDAVDAANEVLGNDSASVADVVKAYDDLNKAYKALEKLGDKEALQNQYDVDIDFATDEYTDTSVKKFNNALAAAKEVLENPDASQAEIDAALAALVAAKNSLVKKPVVSDLDWSEWDKYVKIANAMKESGSYVAEDMAAIQRFIDSVIAYGVDSQEQLDEYTDTLKGMISGASLLKPVNGHFSGKKNASSGSSKTGDNASLAVMGTILASALGLAAVSFKRKKKED